MKFVVLKNSQHNKTRNISKRYALKNERLTIK